MAKATIQGDLADFRDSGFGQHFPGLQALPLDALSSKQHVTIVDVLAEGEIEGFPSAAGLTQGTTAYNNAALKDVFLGKTPILRSNADPSNPQDSDFNFQNIKFSPRFGTANQTFVKGISDIETETGVNVQVVKDTPVTRTISNSNIDAIRVTLRFTALTEVNDEGQTLGRTVDLTIKITDNNGTVTTPISDRVHGRSFNAYSRDYRIDIASGTAFPISVTVTRVSDDSSSSRIRDDFFFTSFTEIIDEQRAYPNIAHVALRFDSEAFSNIPSRMFKIRGTKVKIPHNGSVDSTTGRITYSGTFNGTLTTTTHWTSDPAWVLFDLLTNSRYGLGDHITESQLDKFAFYSASVYASTLVDDGDGGQEPRFSCNTVLQKREDAYATINALSSVMRGMTFWSAGSLSLSVDQPTDPSYLFNLSNVTSEGFSYQGTSLKTRSTAVSVSYFDMENQVLDYETVEDTAAVTKYGRIEKKVTGFGCSSRNQARRVGRFILFEEQNSTETISFATGLAEGVVVRPGQVIEVSDPVKAGKRRGGRINAATTTTVTVDDTAATDLDATNNPTLSVVLSDGTVESRSVSGISGAVITVSSAFSSAPNANSVWILQNDTLQTTTWRVISVSETESQYAIVGTSYNTGKFAFIEDGTAIPERKVTTLVDLLDPPSNLAAQEEFYVEENKAKNKILVTYESVLGATAYQIDYRKDGENYTTVTTRSNDFTIYDADAGVYDIRVSTKNALLEVSPEPTVIQFTTIGKTAIPADVQNLRIEPLSDQFVRLRFDQSTDADVIHGGNVVVRSSNLTTGATFTNSVDVIPELPGNVSESIVPNIVNGTYIVKFKDDGGRLSSGEASVVMVQTVPNTLPKLTVLEDREDTDSPPFAGVKDDCFFSSEVNGLVLGSQVTLDEVTDFDAIADVDFLGDVDFQTGGQYSFANTLDLGGKQPLRLRRHFVTQGFYPNDLIDKRTANVDTWTDFDGATAFNVNAKLLVATTDSDPDTSTAGTYTINNGSGGAGTIITITKSSHGYSVGSFVAVDFTSGTGVDGDYKIQTVPNANTFTLTSATSLTTSGNCNFSAEFSDFNPFVNGTYVARGFKFRADLESSDPAQSIEIDQLGYTAELESRTETSLGNAGASTGGFIASGTSTKSVTFTNSFFTGQSGTSIAANSVLPSIGITIENAESGDFFALSNISSTGFDIDVKNGSSHVNRNFKYAATGFGRGS